MPFGDRLFGDMSRPEHAYALGLVAAAGRMKGDVLEMRLRGDGQPLLTLLEARTSSDIPALFDVKRRRVRVSSPLGELASTYLGGQPGEPGSLRFPELSQVMAVAFVRGLLDAAGRISSPDTERLSVQFQRPDAGFLEALLGFLGTAPASLGQRVVTFRDAAALDVLGLLYDDLAVPREGAPGPEQVPLLCRKKHLRRYLAWCGRVAGLSFLPGSDATLRFRRMSPDAVLPAKSRVSDSGYDLTLIAERKRLSRVVLFGTGLVAEPPQGFYLDVVARSSIIKTGYMLANNVGVIDRAYRGEIMVPLIKLDDSAPELELPARVAQLIPRPIVHFPVHEARELSATERGSGGFGSTG